MHWARFVKYVVLFIFIAVFFTFRNHAALTPDPLIEIFSRALPTLLLATAGIALIGSIFYVRFWCRYLCPVGAFLSLLSGIALLKRLTPAKKFGRCEFGVTGKNQLDCIYCDRCRYELKPKLEPKPAPVMPAAGLRLLSRHFLVPVALIAIFISAVSISTAWQTLSTEMALSSAPGSAGVVRDVDLQKIRTMIRQNRLSDHEADFYKKIEQ